MSLLLALTGGSDVTVALTGVGATAAVGAMLPQSAVPISGVQAAATTGTLAPQLSAPLTGVQAAAARGSVTPALQVSATGLAATGNVGTVVPQFSVSLTGVEAQTATGLLTVPGDVTVALTGAGATALLGALTPAATTVERSGVTRLWLIDYYTRAFEAKKKAAETLALAKKPSKRKAKRLSENQPSQPEEAKIEELVTRAERNLASTLDQVRSARDYEAFMLRIQAMVATPIVYEDFSNLLDRYRVEDEEDDFLMLASVL